MIELDIPTRGVHLDVSEVEQERRRTAINARGDKAWKPATRVREVSTALRVYGLMAASADKGGARELDRLARLERFAAKGDVRCLADLHRAMPWTAVNAEDAKQLVLYLAV